MDRLAPLGEAAFGKIVATGGVAAPSGSPVSMDAAAMRAPALPDALPEARPVPGVHGLLRVGEALVALHVDALQEVIACPARLDALPMPVQGLSGAVRLRGSVIPVLDLRAVFGFAACEAAAPCVIVLMRHAGHLLGLRCDAVEGMADVAAERLHALDVAGARADSVATHAFELGERVATVLDAGRIAALPGVPLVRAPSVVEAMAGGAMAGHGRAGMTGEPVLFFHSGGLPLAVAASAVDATVSAVDLGASPLKRDACVGVLDHHGVEVPVLHLAALLGFSAVEPVLRSAVLVLRSSDGLVGFTMESVRDIARVGANEIVAAPAIGLSDAGLVCGLVDVAVPAEAVPRPPHLLLDHAALIALPLVRSLASLNRRLQPAEARGGSRGQRGRPFVTYRIGFETATPLDQVTEIIAMPSVRIETRRPGSPVVGVINHRQSALPLVDLGVVLDRAAAADVASGYILVVEDAGRRVGLIVDSLGTIESARWEHIQTGTERGGFDRAEFARRPPLVEIGQGEARRSLAWLDLRGLLRTLAAPMAGGSVAAAPAAPDSAGAAVMTVP